MEVFDSPRQTQLRAALFSEYAASLIHGPKGPQHMREYHDRCKTVIFPEISRQLSRLMEINGSRALELIGRAKYVVAQAAMLSGCVDAAALGSIVARVNGLQCMAYIDAELKGMTYTLDELLA